MGGRPNGLLFLACSPQVSYKGWRFVIPKPRTVPDRYAERALLCSAVAKQAFATKAKTTPKPNTTADVHWLQKSQPVLGGTSSKHSRTLQPRYSGKPGAPGAALKFQVHIFTSQSGEKSVGIFLEILIFLYSLFYVRKIRKIFISKTARKTMKEKLKLKTFH